MKVIEKLHQNSLDDPEFYFICPGCNCGHWFKTTGNSPRWSWNEDFEKPTINPSILCCASDPTHRCHSFVRDGKIEYLMDCFHDLKGKTVDLPDIDD